MQIFAPKVQLLMRMNYALFGNFSCTRPSRLLDCSSSSPVSHHNCSSPYSDGIIRSVPFSRTLQENFAFVTRHPLTSQYSSSGVIESLNDLYLDLKSKQNSQKLNVSKN